MGDVIKIRAILLGIMYPQFST